MPAPHALFSYVLRLSCLTYLLLALVFYVPQALPALVPHALCAVVPTCLVSHELSWVKCPYPPTCSRALHASFPMWFCLSRTSCLACFYASRVSCLMRCRAPRASCLTCLVSCVPSCFMNPFPDVLSVPHTLSTLFANVTFCTLEFPYLMLLFFRTFPTWDVFGGYYFSNKDKKLIIEWSIAESASSWICGIRNYMKVFLSH